MEHPKNFTTSTIIISVSLFFIAYFFYDRILDIILPTVNRGAYLSTDTDAELRMPLLFCFSVALIPVFIAAAWAFSPIISANKRLLSALVIVTCVILALYLRYRSLKSYFSMMAEGTMFNVTFPLEEIQFEYYILAGLCLGFVISYSIFRETSN